MTFDGVGRLGAGRARRPTCWSSIGQDADGAPVAGVVEASADGVSVEGTWRYDATRRLGT